MDRCIKCKSEDLDYRSNYEWGEEWNPNKNDNIVKCNNCDYEKEEKCKN